MPVLGLMPGSWSRARDLGGQIWGVLGFVLFALLLLWSERGPVEMDAVSFNKVVVCGHLDAWRCCAVDLLPAGRGGVGKEQSSEVSSASSSWRLLFGFQSSELLGCSWRMV